MAILERIVNSFVFWGAWMIIPVLVEIIPSIGSLFLLNNRFFSKMKRTEKPALYPEISLIVPVYNSQTTLYACIKSINDSSYPTKNIRVFLVNNKGTDDSFAVFAKCQRDFPDLKMQWLNSEQGKSRAMNLALYNSEGKYIINLDSDGILEKNALRNMVDVFESDLDLNVMTGSILTQPELIEETKSFGLRFIQKLEFMEYAQAFLAGRSYASMTNGVYTLSGAFSAFRKQAMLKSRMYNTDTICEDTQITFQMRYIFKERVEVCENALFFVDPIESLNKLYTQRQRWQRGSLEVAKMFQDKKFQLHRVFTDVNIKTIVFDHTFALPRLIWYLATIYLLSVKYSGRALVYSTLLIYVLYIVVGIGYFLYAQAFLKTSPETRKYYWKHVGYVLLLPLFNFLVFFIRVAGVINSINSDSSWRTSNLTDEKKVFGEILRKDLNKPFAILEKLRAGINVQNAGEGTSQRTGMPEQIEKDGQKRKPPRALETGWLVLGGVLLFLLFVMIFTVSFVKNQFGVGIAEVMNTLGGNIEGTGQGMMDIIIRNGVLPCLGVLAAGAFSLVVVAFLTRQLNRKLVRVIQGGLLLACGIAAISLVLYTNYRFGVMSYVEAGNEQTNLYEKYYIDPSQVAITAESAPNNLIYIYVESMECTYTSKEDGGFQNENYIPNLTALARENISFGDVPGKLSGFHMIEGTSWTMAGILATTGGIPFYGQRPQKEVQEANAFLPGITNLGDILEEKGYNQMFICGSKASFANRDIYFKTHGNYEIVDYYTAVEKGYIPRGYYVNWGIEDYRLFEFAKTELLELAAKDEPFNFTMLTVDTHAPVGYVCDECREDYESTTANVVACTDRLVGEFLDWCREQPFYENTTIVITGDHPRMDEELVKGVDNYERRVYNCYINSRVNPERAEDTRLVLTMDIFPSTLAAMGFEIEGERLGLGTNLFSERDTLAEELGYSRIYAESGKKSDYYMTHFHQLNAE